jgi:hypothetical protein
MLMTTQINPNVMRWLILWIMLCTLVIWLPAEIALQASLALGGINLVVLEVNYAELFKKPLSLAVRVLGSTLCAYMIGGFVLEWLCVACRPSSPRIRGGAKVCLDGHLDIGLMVFIAVFALLGSILSGFVLFLYNRRRS